MLRRRKKKSRKILKMLMFILFILICIYNILNYNIYKTIVKAKKNNQTQVVIENKWGYSILWNKTTKYLKDNKINMEVKENSSSIVLGHDKIPKVIHFDISINKINLKKYFSYDISGLSVKLTENNNKVNEIKIDTSKYKLKQKKISLYYINSKDKMILLKRGIEIVDNKIKFNTIVNGQNVEYILVYIPITSIETNIKKDALTLKNGESYKINIKLNPSNSTLAKFNIDILPNKGLSIDSSMTIKASKAGEYNIKMTAENKIVVKNIKVIVNENIVKIPLKKPQTSIEVKKIEKLTYIKGVLIANKKYALPSTYNPGVNKIALAAFNKMKAAAKDEKINLKIVSGFRSYSTQNNLYNKYVKIYGQKATDTFSAKPGHSEHQTGLAFDINSVSDKFASSKEGKWLALNSYKYGFIIRYPKNKTAITGYKYEPWHIRYLGTKTATAVYNSGLCLEEYLGIN